MVILIMPLTDASPSSLMDSIASPKVKTMKRKGVGVHFLAYNISGVEGVLELYDGTRKIDKQFNYSHRHAQTKQEVG
jgi:hypothetical protein